MLYGLFPLIDDIFIPCLSMKDLLVAFGKMSVNAFCKNQETCIKTIESFGLYFIVLLMSENMSSDDRN